MIVFFISLYLLALVPIHDFDIWFHIKSGEVIAQSGIVRTDVFSYSAPGKELVSYEWLFQLGAYWVDHLFGLSGIIHVTAGISTIVLLLVFYISRYVFGISILSAALSTYFYFVWIFEFVTPRPYLLVTVFLLFDIAIIMLYVRKNKNYLWMTAPVTLIWTNVHPSVLFAMYIFCIYTCISFFIERKKAFPLALWSVVTIVLTLLPPVGFDQYRLLSIFAKHASEIQSVFVEWMPLVAHRMDFIIMLTSLALVMILSVWSGKAARRSHIGIWILPLFPFIIASFISSRNLIFAYIPLTLLLAWSLDSLYTRQGRRIAVWIIIIVLCFGSVWLLRAKRSAHWEEFPAKAVVFLQTHQLKGNMYNTLGVGGYLLYHLYPEYKVFIDGRYDVYVDRTFSNVIKFLAAQNLPAEHFTSALYKLFDTYNISYAILPTDSTSTSRRIGMTLINDPQWVLVYWDDHFEILVKRDGKNDSMIEKFGATAATPFESTVAKAGHEREALNDYERIVAISDSAVSRNAMGYILAVQGDVEGAKRSFEQAIALLPTYESPYINLAEIAVSNNNIPEAIQMLKKAKDLNPTRTIIHTRLQELLMVE